MRRERMRSPTNTSTSVELCLRLIAFLSPGLFLRRRVRNPLDQSAELVADRCIRDLRIGAEQSDRCGVGDEPDRDGAFRTLAGRRIHGAFEEGADGNAEYVGDLRKTPGPDAVRSFFILLH